MKNNTLRAGSFLRLTLALLSCLALVGCASQGPVSSPQFSGLVRDVLPPDSGEIQMFGVACWLPQANGLGRLQLNPFGWRKAQRNVKPISCVLIVTDADIFVTHWDKETDAYQTTKRFSLAKKKNVTLHSRNLNRRVTVEWGDYDRC